jgi:hypothetical protein
MITTLAVARIYNSGRRIGMNLASNVRHYPRILRTTRISAAWVLLIMLLIFMLSGCASMSNKFSSGKKADFGFFADHTLAMLSDVDLSIKRNDTIFARRFFDENGPEEKHVNYLDENMRLSLYNIVDYSITLVTIVDSEKTVQKKVADYADFLATFKEDILYGVDMTADQFDATIEEVRNKPDFLPALRTAQPMINAAVIDAIMELNELNEGIEKLADKIDNKIDVEYADVIRYQKKMEYEKSQILHAFETIYDAYRTNNPDLSELAESGVIWMPEIIPQGRPSSKDLETIGKHLRARLDAMHTINQEIQPYWEDYRAAHKELDDLTDQAMDRINQVRLILLVWGRAHQKMASGVVDPAEWFDIKDAPALLFKLGINQI